LFGKASIRTIMSVIPTVHLDRPVIPGKIKGKVPLICKTWDNAGNNKTARRQKVPKAKILVQISRLIRTQCIPKVAVKYRSFKIASYNCTMLKSASQTSQYIKKSQSNVSLCSKRQQNIAVCSNAPVKHRNRLRNAS